MAGEWRLEELEIKQALGQHTHSAWTNLFITDENYQKSINVETIESVSIFLILSGILVYTDGRSTFK